MFAIIFSVILIIIGTVVGIILAKKKMAALIEENETRARYGKDPFPVPIIKFVAWPLFIAVGLSIVIFIVSCLAIVPTGFTGILTTFGRVEERTIPAGLNFIAPWQDVKIMDNRTQKVEIQTSAFSSDIQQVDLKMSVNYCLDHPTYFFDGIYHDGGTISEGSLKLVHKTGNYYPILKYLASPFDELSAEVTKDGKV